MTRPRGPYVMRPPVMSVTVENSMDIMIARNTARRVAGLLGFNPAHQAQLATTAATLAELVLKTGSAHVLHFNGVDNNEKQGVQVSVATPWLAGASTNNVMVALKSKLGTLVDEIFIESEDETTIFTVMWQRENDPADGHARPPT